MREALFEDRILSIIAALANNAAKPVEHDGATAPATTIFWINLYMPDQDEEIDIAGAQHTTLQGDAPIVRAWSKERACAGFSRAQLTDHGLCPGR